MIRSWSSTAPHNPEAFAALAMTLEDEFPALDWTLVVGAMGDKDIEDMLASMESIVGTVIATAVDNDRAHNPRLIAEAAARALPGVAVVEISGVAEAVAFAQQSTSDAGGIVIAGSLYVVGEARGLF